MLRRQPEKCIAKGSKYAHWIGLYLSLLLLVNAVNHSAIKFASNITNSCPLCS